MPRPRAVTTITYDGPFFRKDPAKTFRQNIRGMMDAMAAAGESDVKAQLKAGQAGRKPIRRIGDRVSDHVVGVTSSRSGRRWATFAQVYVNNVGYSKEQGISLMAAAGGLERRVGAFRKTRNRMMRTRKLNTAELMKGIA